MVRLPLRLQIFQQQQLVFVVLVTRDNGCDYDISDQVFTIVSSVTITEPNGGESWQATVGTAGHGQDISSF